MYCGYSLLAPPPKVKDGGVGVRVKIAIFAEYDHVVYRIEWHEE